MVPAIPSNYSASPDFTRSNAPRFHGAEAAWSAGDTGAGQTLAIIDTGIYQSESDFAGRISPLSTDIFSSRNSIEGDTAGEGDHGTFVAKVAAAADNNSGTVGIAPGATIMVIRADTPGSCASTNNCSFGDLAAGITYAVANGAKVINMSLGGSGAAPDEIAAIQAAANAGVVVVIAAGNNGKANPDAYANSLAKAGNGNVIIVGSVNSSGTISSFSNEAGSYSQYFMTALGENVTAYIAGQGYQISGTSFAAPEVAGAAALLAQAFPNLTGQQIVQLLLTSAQDVGVAGVDKVYGYGILDIAAAFAPKGTTSLAGTTTPLSLNATNAVASPAMGDALSTASVKTIVLDKYKRAYSDNIAFSMHGASVSPRLFGAVGSAGRFVSMNTTRAALAFTVDTSGQGAGLDAASQMRLSPRQADGAKVLAARIALRLSSKVQMGLTYAESPDGLVAQLQGQDRPAFMIAPDAGTPDTMFRRTDMSVAVRRSFGHWGLTLAGESGQIMNGSLPDQYQYGINKQNYDGVRSFGVTLDRRFGSLQTALGLNWTNEDRTVLGARFADTFGGGGANSMFVDTSASWQFAKRWRLSGSMRNGWTFADKSSIISDGSQLYTRAWSMDVERQGIFGPNDAIGFRIAQPLRVESGSLKLFLPVAYSYDTQSASFGVLPLNLSPQGREIMGELAWHGPLWTGNASASLFLRRDPGNYTDLPMDKGVAMRWSTQF